MEVVHTIGRRKSAVARLFMADGKGNITINKRPLNEYFTTAPLQYKIQQPLNLTGTEANFDLKITLKGGGITGQEEAVR